MSEAHKYACIYAASYHPSQRIWCNIMAPWDFKYFFCAAATANVCRRISSVDTKICLRKSVVAAHHCGSVCEFFMSCLVLTFKSYDDNYVLLLYRHYECVSDGMPQAQVWA